VIERFRVTKIREGKVENAEEVAIKEIPFTININGRDMVTLVSSPNDLEDLTRGFLFTSGMISGERDINISIDYNGWKAYLESDLQERNKNVLFNRLYPENEAGVLYYKLYDKNRTKMACDFSITGVQIIEVMKDFQSRDRVFHQTGGAHSAAIGSREKGILFFREDIGRHNAVDKAIGAAWAKKIHMKDTFIITSGRVSSELVLKCEISGIPLIISKSAPTSQAVALARNTGIILVGFVRGNNMNIYSEYDRVIL